MPLEAYGNLMYPKPGHPEILQAPTFTRNSGLPRSAQRAPGVQKDTRLDRIMPQLGSRHPGLFQSSQATALELWALAALQGPPWTQLDSVCGHLQTLQKRRKRPDLTGKFSIRKSLYRPLPDFSGYRSGALGFP